MSLRSLLVPFRSYSVTTPTLGGRHTTSRPDRVVHWKSHISKKAKKRYSRRRERTLEQRNSERRQQTDEFLRASPPRLPSEAELRAQSKENRSIIESLVQVAPAQPTPKNALRMVDVDALVGALRQGYLESTASSFTYAIRVCSAHGRFEEALSLFPLMVERGLPVTSAVYNALISACAQQRNAGAAEQVFQAMRLSAVQACVAELSPTDARNWVGHWLAATREPSVLLDANALGDGSGGRPTLSATHLRHGDATSRLMIHSLPPSAADGAAASSARGDMTLGPTFPSSSDFTSLALLEEVMPSLARSTSSAAAAAAVEALPLHALIVQALAVRHGIHLPTRLKATLEERIERERGEGRLLPAMLPLLEASSASPLSQLALSPSPKSAKETAAAASISEKQQQQQQQQQQELSSMNESRYAPAITGSSSNLAKVPEAEGMVSSSSSFTDSPGEVDAYYNTPLLVAASRLVPLPAAASFVAPDTYSYGALMQAHIQAFDLKGAYLTLRDAAIAGIALSVVHFTQLIVGCIHAGQFDRAWETYKHMRRFHARPDAITYTALISACAKTDQVERALSIFEEMKQSNVAPTQVTYNALIYACGRSFRRHGLAHELFSEMALVGGFQRDLYSYNGVILACSHAGDVTRARKYMWQMVGEGLQPSLVTLNTLLAVYARSFRVMAVAKNAPGLTLDERSSRAAEGRDLLKLEDPEAAEAILAAQRKRVVGDYARIVQGPTDDLVEKLLADYYASDKETTAAADPEQERASNESLEDGVAAAKEVARGGQQERASLSLPSLRSLQPDLESKEYTAAKSALVSDGLIDKTLFDELEEENRQYPAIDENEEEVRALVNENELREERRETERGLLALKETADRIEKEKERNRLERSQLVTELGLGGGARGSSPASNGGSGSPPTRRSSGPDGATGSESALSATSEQDRRGRDSDSDFQRQQRKIESPVADLPEDLQDSFSRYVSGRLLFDEMILDKTDAAVKDAGASPSLPATVAALSEKKLTTLERALQGSKRSDGRASFIGFLQALESDLDRQIFGVPGSSEQGAGAVETEIAGEVESGTTSPRLLSAAAVVPTTDQHTGVSSAAAAAAAAAEAAGTTALVRTSSASSSLSRSRPSLFEASGSIGGVPIRDLLDIRTIPLPSTSDSEGNHNVLKLHDHFSVAVGQRVAEALDREFGREDELMESIDAALSDWSPDGSSEDAASQREISAAMSRNRKTAQLRKSIEAVKRKAAAMKTVGASISASSGLTSPAPVFSQPLSMAPAQRVAGGDEVSHDPLESGTSVALARQQDPSASSSALLDDTSSSSTLEQQLQQAPKVAVFEAIADLDEEPPQAGLVRRRRSGVLSHAASHVLRPEGIGPPPLSRL